MTHVTTTAALAIILSTALVGALAGMLAILAIGIHRDDRAKSLTRPPKSCVETATRRLLGAGVRATSPDERDEA